MSKKDNKVSKDITWIFEDDRIKEFINSLLEKDNENFKKQCEEESFMNKKDEKIWSQIGNLLRGMDISNNTEKETCEKTNLAEEFDKKKLYYYEENEKLKLVAFQELINMLRSISKGIATSVELNNSTQLMSGTLENTADYYKFSKKRIKKLIKAIKSDIRVDFKDDIKNLHERMDNILEIFEKCIAMSSKECAETEPTEEDKKVNIPINSSDEV